MKRNILIAIIVIIGLASLAFQTSPYARRIFPVTGVPGSCQENQIAYDMTGHALYICTNAGYQAVSTGGAGAVTSVFTRTGAVIAATNDYTWAQINKATSSLADITTKAEILGVVDLTDYATTSGTGTTALKATFTSLTTND